MAPGTATCLSVDNAGVSKLFEQSINASSRTPTVPWKLYLSTHTQHAWIAWIPTVVLQVDRGEETENVCSPEKMKLTAREL